MSISLVVPSTLVQDTFVIIVLIVTSGFVSVAELLWRV